MFDAFSMRARQVIFAARFGAGARGATQIEVEDFLLALVLEDQGTLGQTVLSKLHNGQGTLLNNAPSHTPFFTQEVAKQLVTRIDELLQQMVPVDVSIEIPISSALERVFGSANAFQGPFPHAPIEPLLLLAGILTEEFCPSARLLKAFGITTEMVMEQLGGRARN